MNNDIEKVIQKIKKLLAMAEHGNSNPNESARAASMAAKLMEQYSIDHADVIRAELKRGDNLSDSILFNRTEIKWPRWMVFLSVETAKLFDCQVKYEYEGRRRTIKVQGYDADVLMVKWMYEYLVEDLTRQSVRYANEHPGGGRSVKISFLRGAVDTLRARFKEIINERLVENSTAGTSLMVVKQDAIGAKYGLVKYSKHRGDGNTDSGAYGAGQKAGNRVNINRPLGEAKQTGRLN